MSTHFFEKEKALLTEPHNRTGRQAEQNAQTKRRKQPATLPTAQGNDLKSLTLESTQDRKPKPTHYL
jgi:hypothetical protein